MQCRKASMILIHTPNINNNMKAPVSANRKRIHGESPDYCFGLCEQKIFMFYIKFFKE